MVNEPAVKSSLERTAENETQDFVNTNDALPRQLNSKTRVSFATPIKYERKLLSKKSKTDFTRHIKDEVEPQGCLKRSKTDFLKPVPYLGSTISKTPLRVVNRQAKFRFVDENDLKILEPISESSHASCTSSNINGSIYPVDSRKFPTMKRHGRNIL